MSNRFVFDNEDSDDEPETVVTTTRSTVAQPKQKPKPELKISDSGNYVFKSEEVKKEEQKLELNTDNFPILGKASIKPTIGAWGMKSSAHEYADTGVKASIKMPPAFRKSNKKVNEISVIQKQNTDCYYCDDESDVEFENGDEDDDFEHNAELGQYRKDGDIW